MIYKLDLSPPSPLAFMPITGAMLLPSGVIDFVPWTPSDWPDAPTDDHEFLLVVKPIFELSMLLEISGVIDDATARTGSINHRGHVIAIALFCALDAISSYGYGARNGEQTPFVSAHFPSSYKVYAGKLLVAYRHVMVHNWNLFTVSMFPGEEEIAETHGVLSLGVLNLFNALKQATEDFLERAAQDASLMASTRNRYTRLRRRARAILP